MYEFLEKISDPVGIIGVVLILLAYYFVTTGKMKGNSMLYQFLNFTGAALLLFSLCFHWNLSSIVIQIVWIIVSLMGMYKARNPEITAQKPHFETN